MHTFRLVTDDGDTKFVKWHWKTKQGKASLVWDEAQHLAGKNADYHRADLWNAIESGNGPEWELNAQIFDEDQALEFGFDVLDATKIIPEEYVPLQPLGVLKLDANPVNYFAETEQVMVSYAIPWARSRLTCVVPTWPYCSRDRFYQRPSAAGTYLFLPRYPAQPSWRSQL